MPDMQRLRMALPYFAEFGWEPVVAAAHPDSYSVPKDELLVRTVPEDTRIVYPEIWNEKKCRRLGFGHIAYRAVWPWRRALRDLMAAEKFDLLFFTTTQMAVLLNGPYLRRETGVPYVIDIQDPIYIPGGAYTKANAPGAYWKYRAAMFVARFIESHAMSCVAGVMSTSDGYVETLQARYPRLRQVPTLTLPFGVAENDLVIAREVLARQHIFDPATPQRILLYAGRGGPDLQVAWRALLTAVKNAFEENLLAEKDIRIVAVGTSYRTDGLAPQQIQPIAQELGCSGAVDDRPDRVGYFEVLRASQDADCVLVLGTPSADYTASKALLSLAAANRVLAIVHRRGLVYELYKNDPKVLMCAFDDSPTEPACLQLIKQALVRLVAEGVGVSPGKAIPESYTARGMTSAMCQFFDTVCSSKPGSLID